MKKLDKTTVNSLFNSIPKIVSLIALLFILLFSISCKSKQEPTEAVIPQEYSGKYILSYGDGNYNSDFYYKTTSSNCIISSEKYNNGAISYYITPIVFKYTDFYYAPSLIVYNVYSDKYGGNFYSFSTNEQSQRKLTLTHSGGYDWWMIYIHEDDINK